MILTTDKLRELLTFMVDQYGHNDAAPTVREVMSALTISSSSVAHLWLERLEEVGLLVNRQRRGFIPTKKAREPRTVDRLLPLAAADRGRHETRVAMNLHECGEPVQLAS